MFELIINILLFIFLGFTFFTHVLEAAVPASVARNPYALQPDVWPKTIIILLEICIIIRSSRRTRAIRISHSALLQRASPTSSRASCSWAL